MRDCPAPHGQPSLLDQCCSIIAGHVQSVAALASSVSDCHLLLSQKLKSVSRTGVCRAVPFFVLFFAFFFLKFQSIPPHLASFTARWTWPVRFCCEPDGGIGQVYEPNDPMVTPSRRTLSKTAPARLRCFSDPTSILPVERCPSPWHEDGYGARQERAQVREHDSGLY